MQENFFTKINYLGILIGVLALVIGFFALSRPPVTGFMTMTFAPILLTIAYCVIFPLAIMLRGSKKESE